MSGEATVTPGLVWSNQDVTHARLALTANPTVQVDAASIGTRELVAADVEALAASPSRGINLFRNPNFWKETWETAAGISATAAARTFNAEAWFARPAGAAVTYQRDTDVKSGSEYNLHSAELVGASSVTTVEFGQYVDAKLAAQLAAGDFTVSFLIKNLTNASLTPKLYINVSNTEDDEENVTTDATPDTLSAVTNGEWSRLEATRDGSVIASLDNGFEVVVQLPSGSMDDGTKSVIFAQMQLEPASAATSFVIPMEPRRRKDNQFAAAAPTVDDDQGQGYAVGSEWIDTTNSRIYRCTDATVGAAVWKLTTPPDMAVIRQVESSGVNGDALVAGAWRQRTLNEITEDEGSIVTSLATNQFVLPAGEYEVVFWTSQYQEPGTRSRLRSTDDAVIIGGINNFAQGLGNDYDAACSMQSKGTGRFSITASKTFELQTWVTTGTSRPGGIANSFAGEEEIYNVVQLKLVGP